MKPLSKITAVANHLKFRVGRDPAGHWLAIEDHGLGGGIFASKQAALDYAKAECARARGAVRVVRQTLDFGFGAAR